jgi:phenylpropionate dioxygenase-like ring-hydroxylating dioxygenase large terminal subunit
VSEHWVRVASSDELVPGAIVDAVLDDREIVVWRTFDGRVCALDARCPHQWSHLGAEGFVDGDELVCTSHFWRFTTDGVGSKVNVNGRRDPKADIDVFPCAERDGSVWVSYG